MNSWLAAATVDPAVFALRPDYRAVLILADGLTPGPSDAGSEVLLTAAEETVRADQRPIEQHGQIAAWRETYRAFGAKPQKTRPSMEALIRRAGDGLPRIDRITDTYNAISVTHGVPIGGENADAYQGPARLIRAAGTEPFDTTAAGEPVTERAEPGEVVWVDDAGITCRRWNWRQGVRTRLTTSTVRALFIVDSLGADSAEAVSTALLAGLAAGHPGVSFEQRTLAP